MNTCHQCQAAFQGIRVTQKYCSAGCRKAARRAYQRAYKRVWLASQPNHYHRDAMRSWRAQRCETHGGDHS